MKSPSTYGNWEWGYFTASQLEDAGAYRTDLDPDEDGPLFPDGGTPEDVQELEPYQSKLDAVADRLTGEFEQ